MESCAKVQPARTGCRSPDVAFAHLDCPAPLEGLQADTRFLLRQSWMDHVNRLDYHGNWDVLPLRCQREYADAHPLLQAFAITAGDEWQDLPVLQQCPSIRALLTDLACPLKAVRLMRLRAGAVIKPHRDTGLAIEYGEARLHLPVFTSDEVIFRVDQQRAPMRAGELWYINADREHEVHNLGQQDRINLVIDCETNDWLCERIHSAPIVSRCGSSENTSC